MTQIAGSLCDIYETFVAFECSPFTPHISSPWSNGGGCYKCCRFRCFNCYEFFIQKGIGTTQTQSWITLVSLLLFSPYFLCFYFILIFLVRKWSRSKGNSKNAVTVEKWSRREDCNTRVFFTRLFPKVLLTIRVQNSYYTLEISIHPMWLINFTWGKTLTVGYSYVHKVPELYKLYQTSYMKKRHLHVILLTSFCGERV